MLARFLGLACLTASLSAAAEDQPTRFAVERFRPALDLHGVMDVESAHLLQPLQMNVSVWTGYAHEPLALYRRGPDGLERVGALVGPRVGAHVGGAIGVFDWLQVGVEVPGVLFQAPGAVPDGVSLPSLAVAGLGDVRLAPKLRLLTVEQAFVDVALMPSVTVPTSAPRGSYLGEKFFTFAPELLVSREVLGIRFAGDVGYRARSLVRSAGVTAGHEVFYRAGIGLPLSSVGLSVPLDLEASLHGGAAVVPTLLENTPLEGLVGVRWNAGAFNVTGAAGAGILGAPGVPDVRATLGLLWNFDFKDGDDDHVENDVDKCAEREEDPDGIADGDGCPEDDADGDGLADFVDRCPEAAEDPDAFEDADGCPDLDDDQDTVADAVDRCPRKPGKAEWQGCPPPDRDGDRLADHVDRCPDEAAPGTADGCPSRVVVTRERVEIQDRFAFDFDSARLLPSSSALLDTIARTLIAHPEVKRVRIEGHTDDAGFAVYNLKLSSLRAEAVRDALVKLGVEAGRLEVEGYGAGRPLMEGTNEAARAANRRVEITVLEQDPVVDEGAAPASPPPSPPSPSSPSPPSAPPPSIVPGASP